MAIAAGNDMAISTHFSSDWQDIVEAVGRNDASGLTEERLDEAVVRVLKWKLRMGAIR
jgi:beta-glucosidase-like glycosyl hydrolase